jgi:hypothetical protein
VNVVQFLVMETSTAVILENVVVASVASTTPYVAVIFLYVVIQGTVVVGMGVVPVESSAVIVPRVVIQVKPVVQMETVVVLMKYVVEQLDVVQQARVVAVPIVVQVNFKKDMRSPFMNYVHMININKPQ